MEAGKLHTQTAFDRALYNEKKLGAYYTDAVDAMLLRNLFKFPNEPCCCIDPSCGDGGALGIVTGKAFGHSSIVNFGIEIDRDRYLEAKTNPCMDYVIMADFMQEVKISRECFSFGYLNPPYGESLLKERWEKIFFKRLDCYLKPGAFLCFVVPYYIFVDDLSLSKIVTNRYDIKSCFKFKEFAKFKQIVVICQKKPMNCSNLAMAKHFQDYVADIDNVFTLPENVPDERKYMIPPSSPDDIQVFQGTGVDMDTIESIPASTSVQQYMLDNALIKDAFGTVGFPPIMPGKSHIYMLATSGYGRGTIGNSSDSDMHLQRGRIIEGHESRSETDPVTHKVTQTIRSFKKTLVTIIQADGKIDKLESVSKSDKAGG